MLSGLWLLIWWFVCHIPWLIMAALAGLAWSKQRKSAALFLEMLGALAIFLLAVASYLVFKLLFWTHASSQISSPVRYVLDFLELVALLTFAVGFCWEKINQRRAARSQAAAVVATRIR